MNIAVIGATGMVGERIVAEAVARGHQVDAYRHGQPLADFCGLYNFHGSPPLSRSHGPLMRCAPTH